MACRRRKAGMQWRTRSGGFRFPDGRWRGASAVTTSGPPTETSTVGEFDDDALTLTTQIGQDSEVTVSVVGEVDAFTAPMLRSVVAAELERHPSELVLD